MSPSAKKGKTAYMHHFVSIVLRRPCPTKSIRSRHTRRRQISAVSMALRERGMPLPATGPCAVQFTACSKAGGSGLLRYPPPNLKTAECRPMSACPGGPRRRWANRYLTGHALPPPTGLCAARRGSGEGERERETKLQGFAPEQKRMRAERERERERFLRTC